MKGASLLAQLLGGIAACTYLVFAAGWGVLGILLAINITTAFVAWLVKS